MTSCVLSYFRLVYRLVFGLKLFITSLTSLIIFPPKPLARPPYFALHHMHPDYLSLRVFGCLCYPNTASTMSHKLAPRSSACVFLGYSPHHKGYRCMDLATQRVLISCHVVFNESTFPFASLQPPSAATYEFLDDVPSIVVSQVGYVLNVSIIFDAPCLFIHHLL
jgi:hypothetical protein